VRVGPHVRGADIADLGGELLQPVVALCPAIEGVGARFRERDTPLAQALGGALRLARRHQPGLGLVADRLQQAVAGRGLVRSLLHDQRLRHQPIERRIRVGQVRPAADRAHRVACPTGGEGGQPPQQRLLVRGEEGMAPIKERLDIPLARGPAPTAGPAGVQGRDHVGGERRQGLGAELRRDEFEQQRQSVQACTERGDRRGILGGHGEVGIGLYRARAEKLRRLALREFDRGRIAPRFGEGEGGDAANHLPRQSQRLATGRQELHAARPVEEKFCQRGDGRAQMLAVVEDEQHAPIAQFGDEGIAPLLSGTIAYAQGGGDRVRDTGAPGGRDEIDEPDVAGEGRTEGIRDLEG